MKFESLKENTIVYDCHSHKMGNSHMRSLGIWTIKVLSIDKEKRTCMASWNGNAPRTHHERDVKKWLKEKPTLVRNVMGGYRRMTKDEKAAAKKAGITSPIVH